MSRESGTAVLLGDFYVLQGIDLQFKFSMSRNPGIETGIGEKLDV